MKRKSLLIIYLLIISSIGCASIHSGNYAIQVNNEKNQGEKTSLGLIISGRENYILASKYFGVIDFTFENTSQEWIRIEKIKVDFGNDEINKNITFTSGQDIDIWYKSIEKRNIIQDFNTKMIIGAIAGFGAGLALSSNRKNIQDLGAITAIGAVTSLSVYEFNRVLDKVENVSIFPENHLFAQGFAVPPGLFVKKWLLLNSKNHEEIGYVDHLFIEYQTDDKKIEKLRLNFRIYFDQTPSTRWQEDCCRFNREKD